MASMRSGIELDLLSRPLAAAAGVRPSVREARTVSAAPTWFGRSERALLVDEAAEPAGSLLVVADGLVQVFAVEVWPQDRREIQFGVGRLPQQEVRYALLTARPDDEVGVGRVGVIQPGRDALRRELAAVEATGVVIGDQPLHR